MKNIMRRIENIETLLGDEPPPGKLSPALQEAVDKLIRRLELNEDKTTVEEKVPQRVSKVKLSPALQEAVDRIIRREK